jgi:hypothetical protein
MPMAVRGGGADQSSVDASSTVGAAGGTVIGAPTPQLTAVSVAGYHALAIGPGNAVCAWGNHEARGCGHFDAVTCADTQVPTLVYVP